MIDLRRHFHLSHPSSSLKPGKKKNEYLSRLWQSSSLEAVTPTPTSTVNNPVIIPEHNNDSNEDLLSGFATGELIPDVPGVPSPTPPPPVHSPSPTCMPMVKRKRVGFTSEEMAAGKAGGKMLHHCSYCKYVSNRRYDVMRHERTVHLGIREHRCDLCDFESKRRGDLIKHKKRAHGEDIDDTDYWIAFHPHSNNYKKV